MRGHVLTAVFIVIWTVALALAQTPDQARPGTGLFGGPGDTEQSLVVGGMLGVTYFDILDSAALQDALVPKHSWASQGLAQIGYDLTKGHVGLAASADSIATHFPSLPTNVLMRYDANLSGNFAVPVTARTQVTGSQMVQYAPSFLQGLPTSFAANIDPTILAANLGTAPTNFVRSATGLGLTHEITRRTSLL